MEYKKRKRNMAKPNGNPLSALDAFIKAEAEASKPREPDEFTVSDYIERLKASGLKINLSSCNRKLKDLEEVGVLKRRRTLEAGRFRNLYRFL
jgi:hypothetical protein